MRIMVIGSGGREHALAWKLLQSPTVSQVYCVPGNAGMAMMSHCSVLPHSTTDFQGLIQLAQDYMIDLTVVGPEIPLAQGICDQFQKANLPIFGPRQAAAQIESSKSWAKALLKEARIPTADYAVFQSLQPALDHLKQVQIPVVIKADGLAAGKGVTVAMTLAEATQAVTALFEGQLGEAGLTVIIEDFLIGEEASVLAFCDGHTYQVLPPVQDHKRLGIGDTGPNTGGMGAYTPASRLITPPLLERIKAEILDPTLAALTQQGIAYKGILYAGLMIDQNQNPLVLEFNCRFGDPETQVLMPLLQTPLDQVLVACVEGTLTQITLEWSQGYSACVVMAAAGYPGAYQRGLPISGLEAAANTGALIFHAGTQLNQPDEVVLTDGGRILAATGQGYSLAEALTQAYRAIQYIDFEGHYYRPDIGYRELGEETLQSILTIAETPS